MITIITLPRERKAKEIEAHRGITAQGASTETETESPPEGNLMTRPSPDQYRLPKLGACLEMAKLITTVTNVR
jgi:hypothetical protein